MMKIDENISLAQCTTLHIGGPARYFICVTERDDVYQAIDFARAKRMPVRMLGAGSNVLVKDYGYAGIVLHFQTRNIACEGEQIIADAGAKWDSIVDAAIAEDLYGIENLAGIPGTLGGAIVQNIGAYGAEIASVVEYIEVINQLTGEACRLYPDDAQFAYRSSIFKTKKELIITSACFRLKKQGSLVLTYPDLVRAQAQGVSCSTPKEVASAVREIRASKFPQDGTLGTAGSFFKNPVITIAHAKMLKQKHPDLPLFNQCDNTVKVPLAWLLDRALSLKGLSIGGARLYERQPLVIVTEEGATADDVDLLAQDVARRVYFATSIKIEREVETFSDTK